MNGIILVDKPRDWTSHDVVGKLRGVLHERRIGHSGTLDPMATGLLVVFVGRATRAVEFAEADSKEYVAGIKLGITTDTQDITGNVLSTCDVIPDKNELLAALNKFRGNIEQIPPMYSAIKINGQKLYELARKGKSVERKPRSVTISRLELTDGQGCDYTLEVECSKGTYIRTLCDDIGQELSCGACMSSLRRTRAGAFDVKNAYSIEQIIKAAEEGRADSLIIPVDELFCAYQKASVSINDENKLRNGNVIKTRLNSGSYRVYSETGEFLLLGEVTDGRLKTIKNFFEVSNDR